MRSRNLHTRILGQLSQRSPYSRVIISDKSQEMHNTVFSQLLGKTPVYIHRLAIHGDWMKVYIDESGNLGGLSYLPDLSIR